MMNNNSITYSIMDSARMLVIPTCPSNTNLLSTNLVDPRSFTLVMNCLNIAADARARRPAVRGGLAVRGRAVRDGQPRRGGHRVEHPGDAAVPGGARRQPRGSCVRRSGMHSDPQFSNRLSIPKIQILRFLKKSCHIIKI